MKLHYAPFSPYARKVRAVAIEAGLGDRIELIATMPREAGEAYGRVNPLQRIPALVLEDGEVLYDSPVICEYLDWLNTGRKLFPAPGPARWQALRLQALGDGIMDSSVPRRQESLRPAAQQSPEQLQSYVRQVRQALDALEGMTGGMGEVNIGTIAVACALGYLDARFPDDGWRKGRPKLAAWEQGMAARPSMQQTRPQ
ncbi:MAG: glutathione S-transferase N-terminal domain-containing protein [Alphaproteobacteria bacterium]|nr:glutathione S-transferase N-terminal domain-containing protein [Alphaproteobacteria bacterium]